MTYFCSVASEFPLVVPWAGVPQSLVDSHGGGPLAVCRGPWRPLHTVSSWTTLGFWSPKMQVLLKRTRVQVLKSERRGCPGLEREGGKGSPCFLGSQLWFRGLTRALDMGCMSVNVLNTTERHRGKWSKRQVSCYVYLTITQEREPEKLCPFTAQTQQPHSTAASVLR